MYSQTTEDDIIATLVPDSGIFMEIGAYDPKIFSNTLRLLETGKWKGVLVEPEPHCFINLMSYHKDNPNITLVNALLGIDWDFKLFHVTPDAVSTTDSKHFTLWKGTVTYQDVYVPMLPLATLFASFPGPYDFISVDTEGTTFALTQWVVLNAKPGVLCTEHQNVDVEDIKKFVTENGYTFVSKTRENLIFKRTDLLPVPAPAPIEAQT